LRDDVPKRQAKVEESQDEFVIGEQEASKAVFRKQGHISRDIHGLS
jgi:hypothetical protein